MSVAGLASVELERVAPSCLTPDDVFILPRARSALLQHTVDADGAPILTLYAGAKEVSWDDPRHFSFAEALASGSAFTASEAAKASELEVSELAPMLEALLDQGLLARADVFPAPAGRHDNMPMPSPLPPAPMALPRTWLDTDSLMAELTGTALDSHWLEVAVPVFRSGHLFLDRDGRHIGEANTFPAAARSEVPTDWRGCPYAGNRYQAEKPMNMTALKAMRAHWRQMMGLLLPIREAYLQRFPDARSGWTVAHVERLSVCVLALPSYMMLRCDAPVANGDLHPALSNLFRVTDGLRMVMHHMMFVPLYEPMHQPNAAVSIDAILAYADRNFLFHSDLGVCAGPRFMVEDFLAVLLDGATPRSGFDPGVDAELVGAVGLIEPAMDYGLLGLQTFGAVFSLWPAMARCYDHLHTLLSGSAAASFPGAATLAARFAEHFVALSHRSFLASEDWRSHREAVYDDMFAACGAGVAAVMPDEPLSTFLGAAQNGSPSEPIRILVEVLADHFGPGSGSLAAAFADEITGFLARAQRIVSLAETIQGQTAGLLHRSAPTRPLSLQDINLHNVLMGEDQRSVPFLPDELGSLLNIAIHVDSRRIQIVRGPCRARPYSPDFVPADTPCMST